jgi:hypothetical protein
MMVMGMDDEMQLRFDIVNITPAVAGDARFPAYDTHVKDRHLAQAQAGLTAALEMELMIRQ